MTAPRFDSTYDEYVWLRQQLGYDPEIAIARHVWERCDAESQENMLGQFRDGLWHQDRYVETHGDVW